MAKYMDDLEESVGIKAYATCHASCNKETEGFTAVLKARYSDFIVHEVDLNGNRAILDKLEFPQDSSKKIKLNNEKSSDSKQSTPSEQTTCKNSNTNVQNKDIDNTKDIEQQKKDFENAFEELSKILSSDIARSAIDLLIYWCNPSNNESNKIDMEKTNKSIDKSIDNEDKKKYFLFPIIQEKNIRTKIHQLIKGATLQKYAIADTINSQIRLWPKQFKKDVRDNYHSKQKHNSQYKKNKRKNKDWPQNRPNYLKFVLYKENLDTNSAIKDIVRNSNVSTSLIQVAGMKDKRGVTSQFCTLYQQEANQLILLNQHNGGKKSGGYSSYAGTGLLRVGNFEYCHEPLRLGSLLGNRFDIALRNVQIDNDDQDVIQHLNQVAKSFQNIGFINYFGMQRFGKSQDTHKVGIEILKGNFQKAIDMLMNVKSDEQERFTKAKIKWSSRFDDIKKDDEESMKQAEQNCAKSVIRDLGRFMLCEISIMKSLSKKPRDYKTAFRCIMKNTQLMFLHAVQSYIWNCVASHRISTYGSDKVIVGDLVLVKDTNKNTGLQGKSVEIITEENIDKYDITNVVLPLPGSKVQYPIHESGALYKTLLSDLGMDEHVWKQSNRELSLGGDYRKLICKPIDVTYEIKQYTNPTEPLITTDLMKIQGHQTTNNTLNNEEKHLVGLVIGFTLPPSSYATIALRELMKRPTSSTYQSKLSLDGKNIRDLENKP